MKTQMPKFLFVFLMSIFCSLCVASPEENSLDRLLLLSGITKQVGQFPSVLKAGIMYGAQQANHVSDDDITMILDSVDGAILPSVVLDEIRESLEKSLNVEDVATLLAWYESDVARRITAAEESASTPEAYHEMMNTTQQLLANTERVQVANRLDKLVGATDMNVKMQEFMGVAVYSAIMIAMAPDQALSLDAYKLQMAAIAPQMRAGMEQLVTLSLVYSYQHIDDDSLARYEAFLNLPRTRNFNDSAVSGLNRGFEKIVASWAIDIAAILKSSVRKQSESAA